MTATITDVTTTVTSPAAMIAAARNDAKVNIGYISGVHVSEIPEENGRKCGGCLAFNADHIPTMAAHSNTSRVVRMEVPLTGEGFAAFAQGMGGTMEGRNLTIGGKTIPAGTPMIFAYSVDNAGKVSISSVLPGVDAKSTFATWLTEVETAHKQKAAETTIARPAAPAVAPLSAAPAVVNTPAAAPAQIATLPEAQARPVGQASSNAPAAPIAPPAVAPADAPKSPAEVMRTTAMEAATIRTQLIRNIGNEKVQAALKGLDDTKTTFGLGDMYRLQGKGASDIEELRAISTALKASGVDIQSSASQNQAAPAMRQVGNAEWKPVGR